jgi:hypothetical protein
MCTATVLEVHARWLRNHLATPLQIWRRKVQGVAVCAFPAIDRPASQRFYCAGHLKVSQYTCDQNQRNESQVPRLPKAQYGGCNSTSFAGVRLYSPICLTYAWAFWRTWNWSTWWSFLMSLKQSQNFGHSLMSQPFDHSPLIGRLFNNDRLEASKTFIMVIDIYHARTGVFKASWMNRTGYV